MSFFFSGLLVSMKPRVASSRISLGLGLGLTRFLRSAPYMAAMTLRIMMSSSQTSDQRPPVARGRGGRGCWGPFMGSLSPRVGLGAVVVLTGPVLRHEPHHEQAPCFVGDLIRVRDPVSGDPYYRVATAE